MVVCMRCCSLIGRIKGVLADVDILDEIKDALKPEEIKDALKVCANQLQYVEEGI